MKKTLDLLETICVISSGLFVGISLFVGLRHPHPGVVNVEGATLAAGCCLAFLAYLLKPRGPRR
jgi:hypothetical protein